MWRVAIEQNFTMNGVSIYLGRKSPDGMAVIKPVTTELETVPEGVVTAPSLMIDDELGRALLDALNGYYGEPSDYQRVCADLSKERERVDRLLSSLLTMLHTAQERMK